MMIKHETICDKCGESLGKELDPTKMLALWGRLEGESKKDKIDGRTWHYCKPCAAKALEVILHFNCQNILPEWRFR